MCNHAHQTIAGATACISEPGGYVVAVEAGQVRALKHSEEMEFQAAMYGTPAAEAKRKTTPDSAPLPAPPDLPLAWWNSRVFRFTG